MIRSLDDTIVAISTPVGEGGIGIVRLSGAEALSILQQLFRPTRSSRTPGPPDSITPPSWHPLAYHLHYGHIVDPADEAKVDEVLVSYMPGPKTYTRQDVVEINAHGGVVPLRRILELCLRHGARLAEPGEFTLRAFLNGRIDLAQAEAVLDVVRAKTAASLRVAVGQLEGRLSDQVRAIRRDLINVLAYLEASIDFVEDEIPPRDVGPELEVAQKRLSELLASAEQGIIYRQGVRVAIVGRPNVGKSSLLNALLRTSRAIVTPIPGTTRDTLEETLNLRGVPVILVDTAGITQSTEDVIERLGIERSRTALAQADLALLVVDGSEPLTPADQEIADLIGKQPAIVVVNKSDLLTIAPADRLLPEAPHIRISALTGAGLDELEAAIIEQVMGGRVLVSDVPLVSRPRHQALLARAQEHVVAARASLLAGLPEDFLAIDVRAAINALGELTGERASEDLLDTIFAEFCIGK